MIYINNPYLKAETLLENITALLKKDKKKKNDSVDLRSSVLFQVQNSVITNLLNQPRINTISEMQKFRELFLSKNSEEVNLLQKFPELYRIVKALFEMDAASETDRAGLSEVVSQLQQKDKLEQLVDEKALNYWNNLKVEFPLFKDCGQDSLSFALFTDMAQRFDVFATLIEKNSMEEEQPYVYAMRSLVLLTAPRPEPASEEKVESALRVIAKELYDLASIDGPKGQSYYDLFLGHLNLENWSNAEHLEHWRALIQQERIKKKMIFDMIAQVQKVEAYCDIQKKELPKNLKEANTLLAQINYARYSEDPEFADICYKYKVDEYTFESSLDYLQQGSSWPRKKDDLMPKESTHYQDINPETQKKEKEFLWVKLPVTDKRALILGKITDCCQSIAGDSEQCVKDAVSLQHNALYVLLERKRGDAPVVVDGQINEAGYKIVGQSYAWLSRLGNLCLDSVECLKDAISDDTLRKLLQQWSAQVLESDPSIRFVTVGTGGKTPQSWGKALPGAFIPEEINEGLFYDDSYRQYILASRKAGQSAEIVFTPSPAMPETLSLEYFKYYASPELAFQLDMSTNNYFYPTAEMVSIFLNNMMAQGAIPVSIENYQALRSKENFKAFLMDNVTMISDADLTRSLRIFSIFDDQRRDFFIKIRDRLCAYFDSTFLSRDLFSTEEKAQISEEMLKGEKFFSLIKTAEDFHDVMNFLEDDKKVELSHEMMKGGRLRSLIKTGEDFHYVMNFLEDDKKVELSQEMMSGGKLFSLIKTGEDFYFVMEYLEDDKKVELSHEMMSGGMLRSLIKTAEDFVNVMEYLEDDKKVELSHEMMKGGMLRSLIKTAEDFASVIEFLDDDNKTELYQKMMKWERLLSLIKTAEDFASVIEFLDDDNKTEVYQKMMKGERLLSLMKTAEDFASVIKFLDDDNKTEVYQKMMKGEKLLSLIKTAEDFASVIEFLDDEKKTELSQKAELLGLSKKASVRPELRITNFNEELWNYIVQQGDAESLDVGRLAYLIQNLDELVAVFARMPSSWKRFRFSEAIMKEGKLISLIKNASDFYIALEHIDSCYKASVVSQLMTEGKLTALVTVSDDFNIVMELLPENQKAQFLEELMKNKKLHSFIKTADSFENAMRSLAPENKSELFANMMQDGSCIGLLQKVLDFIVVRDSLPINEKSQLFEAMLKEGALIALIKGYRDFQNMLLYLSNDEKSQLFQEMHKKKKLLDFLREVDDINRVIYLLPVDKKVQFFLDIATQGPYFNVARNIEILMRIVKNIEDVEEIRVFLLKSGKLRNLLIYEEKDLINMLNKLGEHFKDYLGLAPIIEKSRIFNGQETWRYGQVQLSIVIDLLREIECNLPISHNAKAAELFLFGIIGEKHLMGALNKETDSIIKTQFQQLLRTFGEKSSLIKDFSENTELSLNQGKGADIITNSLKISLFQSSKIPSSQKKGWGWW